MTDNWKPNERGFQPRRKKQEPPVTTHLDVDLMPLVEKMFALLLTEPNVIRQQQTLELLLVKQALRIGSAAQANIVVDGVYKHAKQLLQQMSEP